MSVAFTFDQARCTGCQACILACTIENELAFAHSWRTVYTYNERHYPGQRVQHLSLSCNHCEDPACLRACPASAYSKNGETGFVELDETKCIGCRYCAWACPFAAPVYSRTEGVVGKCTFCSDRLESGREPACVEYCPTGALGLVERVSERQRQVVSGFPRTALGPAIAITPAGERRTYPEMVDAGSTTPFLPKRKHTGMAGSLREEWPLAAFTLLVAILVGLLSASIFTGAAPSVLYFIGLAALAVLLSGFHLGKKRRAWRAVLNPATSWLSRELLMLGAFACFGSIYLTVGRDISAIGWLALAMGFASLIAMDRVYTSLPLIDTRRYHSASTVLTGLLLMGVFSANPLVAGTVGAGKLALYLKRKLEFRKPGKPARPLASALRVAAGFLTPGIAWALNGVEAMPLVVVSALVGELIDRLEFYAELDILNPEKQMVVDLHEATSS